MSSLLSAESGAISQCSHSHLAVPPWMMCDDILICSIATQGNCVVKNIASLIVRKLSLALPSFIMSDKSEDLQDTCIVML